MAMTRFKNIPASAASTLVEGYCSDFIQLSASLAQTLEQVSMRNLPLGASRGSLERVEKGMRELSDAIAILLRETDRNAEANKLEARARAIRSEEQERPHRNRRAA